MPLEQLTKAAVIISALGAVLFESWQAGRELPHFFLLTIVTAIAAGAAARRSPERTAGLLVAAGYFTPVLLLLIIGYRFYYVSIWIAAVLGALTATTTPLWQYPSRLRLPLVAWALAVAMTWPIVALRLVDWNPSVLWAPPPPGMVVHAIPAITWVVDVTLVHLLGLLWVDWLFSRFGGEADTDRVRRFERVIVYPLLAAAVVAGLLPVYQGLVDLRFLSIGGWADIGRATGALVDANPSGALSALWVPIALALAFRQRSGLATAALALCAAVLLIGIWATGSRTSMLCALIGLAALIHIAFVGRRGWWKLLVAVAVALAVFAIARDRIPETLTGPLRRIALPSMSPADIQATARTLFWERDGYGAAAAVMIADEPVQGVGIGAFHLLVPDYATAVTGLRIPPDNAQNWFRHQLAELGLLGSIGWAWWSVVVVAALFTRARPGSPVESSVSVKYALAGFGLASLLGMPGQNPIVAITVWTFAFWLLLMTGWPTVADSSTARRNSRSILVASTLAVALAGMTVYAAWGSLRPPVLARRLNAPYEYGLYASIDGRSGRSETTRRAVAVPSAPTSTLRLKLWVEHPDANEHPVTVDVWIDGEAIVHGRFPRTVPMTRDIKIPGDGKRFVLETRVDRTFQSPDNREIGLTFEWEFIEAEQVR